MKIDAAPDALLPARRLAAAGLLLSLLLLPFRAYYELGLAVCLGASLWAMARHRWQPWRAPGFRLFLCAWGAYVLAAVLALPDAVDASASLRVTGSTLRFVGYGLAASLLGPAQWRWLMPACAALVWLWTLDALLQAAIGWSLGGRNQVDRVSGIFGDADLKLGPVLAAMAAFALTSLDGRARVWQIIGVLVLVAAVLLAGARAGWVALSVVLAWWLWRLVRRQGWRPLPIFGGLLLAAGSSAALLYHLETQFAGRVDRTLRLLDGERADVDAALAYRLPIWETAARMAVAHPWNGVGVRGYRIAYVQFAEPGDRWVALHQGQQGASHPHQVVLEVLAETGLIGFLLWLLAASALLQRWRKTSAAARNATWPLAAALVGMVFPLNTHLAFYSSFWGTLWCWLLALYCARLCAPPEHQPLDCSRRPAPSA